MELPKRKSNRLRNYDYGQNGSYFITICTADRQKLLGDIVGGDAFVAPCIELSPYGKIAEHFLCRIAGIDKYVIMPNHIHMVIVISAEQRGPWAQAHRPSACGISRRGPSAPTTPQSIPGLVKSFKGLVTKEIGRSIFQRSFYDHIIRGEQDYREICAYMEANPAKWKLDHFYQT